MEIQTIITLVTIAVTYICGVIAKKHPKFNNKLIPIQNLLIGCIAGGIYYYMTKDSSLVIMTVGLGTGGAYDLAKNLLDLFKGE